MHATWHGPEPSAHACAPALAHLQGHVAALGAAHVPRAHLAREQAVPAVAMPHRAAPAAHKRLRFRVKGSYFHALTLRVSRLCPLWRCRTAPPLPRTGDCDSGFRD